MGRSEKRTENDTKNLNTKEEDSRPKKTGTQLVPRSKRERPRKQHFPKNLKSSMSFPRVKKEDQRVKGDEVESLREVDRLPQSKSGNEDDEHAKTMELQQKTTKAEEKEV